MFPCCLTALLCLVASLFTQVVHLTYTTVSPHPTFNAATLASPSTLLLNCSTSVLALYMSLDATCGREALARCQRAQQAFGVGTTRRTVSNGEQHNGDAPTRSSLEDRSSVDSEGGGDSMSAVSLRSTRSTCAVPCSWRGADSSACFKQLTCHQLFDVEQFLQTALTSEMADGERLFDYDMQIVSAVAPALGLRTWPCGCATRQQPPPPRNHIAVSCTDPTAIVVIGAALQPTTRRAGHADVSTTNRDPSEQRLLALVVSLNLASSVSRLLRKQQVTVSPTHAQRPRLVVDVAKHFAELLRREGGVALSPAHQPVTMSNASVLMAQRSLSALVHPTMPICIRGYRRQAAIAGATLRQQRL